MSVTYLDFERPLAALDTRVAELRAGRTPADVIVGEPGEAIPAHGTLGLVRQHIPADQGVGAVAPETVTEGPAWLARNAPAGGQG